MADQTISLVARFWNDGRNAIIGGLTVALVLALGLLLIATMEVSPYMRKDDFLNALTALQAQMTAVQTGQTATNRDFEHRLNVLEAQIKSNR